MTIPAGYQIHIKTWENDADCYKTQVVSGLEKADVEFLTDLAKKFYSKNAWGTKKKGYGNGCVTEAELAEVVAELRAEHPDVGFRIKDMFPIAGENPDCEDEEMLGEWIAESLREYVLGIPEQYEYDFDGDGTGPFCRVFESYKVYYHPGEVEDVTTQFN